MKWRVIEELLQMIGSALAKGGNEAPRVVEALFELLYHLLTKGDFFLTIIQRHFGLLVFFLYRYPQHTANLHKLSRFFTCFTDRLNNKAWRMDYEGSRVIREEEVAGKLMNIFICQNVYLAIEGESQVEIVKRSQKWFKNAIKCLEIVYGLIQISPESIFFY